MRSSWILAALLVAGAFQASYSLVVLGGSSTSGIAESTLRLHEELRPVPEELYCRDRARRIYGHVRSGEGHPVAGAKITAYQTLDWVEVLALHLREGREPLGVHPSPLSSTESDDKGYFLFERPRLGQKMLFFEAEGYAPRRRSGVLVEDGVAANDMGAVLQQEEGAFLVAGAEEERPEVLPVYRGCWPDLSWSAWPTASDFTLQRREPDGWPRLVALRSQGMNMRLLRLPEEIRVGDRIELEALSPWTPKEGAAEEAAFPGWPHVIESPLVALRLAAGKLAEPDAQESIDGGSVAAMADSGSATIELELESGRRLSAFSDIYGEAVFRGIEPGFHLLRSRLPGHEEWTWPLGIQVREQKKSRIRLFAVDQPRDTNRHSSILFGFLKADREDDVAESLAEGYVYCRAIAGHPEGYFEHRETREGGFYRFVGLRASAVYDLIFCHGEPSENLRHKRRITMPPEPGAHCRSDFLVPVGALRLPLGGETRVGDALVLERAEETPGRRCFARITETQKELTFRGVEAGSYRIKHWRGDLLLRASEVVEIARDEVVVGAGQWK